jgi:anti-anti-sigma factor
MSNPPSVGAYVEVQVTDAGTRGVVVARGEVDLAAEDRLWSCVERACGGGPPVVVDCSQVTFMGSAGIHVLIRAYQRLGSRPGAVVVRNPSVQVRRVLSLTGVDRYVRVDAEAPGGEADAPPSPPPG